MIKESDIEIIEKVAKTLLRWSGEGPGSDDNVVIIADTLPQHDITYGDVLDMLDLVSRLRNKDGNR